MVQPIEIDELLFAIEQTQDDLSQLYADKRAAIRTASVEEMNRLTEREGGLVSLMETHMRRRQQILGEHSTARPESLEAVVRTLKLPDQQALLDRIERTRRTMAANRRESWVLWIVTQQSLRFFGDVIDFIANGGHKTPVYSARRDMEKSVGGAIFDASA